MQMDLAFPFVSSSDRSKYIELCQALSKLNGLNANPGFEDRLHTQTPTIKLKKVGVDREDIGLQPQAPVKGPLGRRKPAPREQSVSYRNQPKASISKPGNKQVQQLVTKRSATHGAPGGHEHAKSLTSNENAIQQSRSFHRSQARTRNRVKANKL